MAKLDLHKKTEVKEQLTEHLCAIIQQNELRKAHKLEELMQQLQLQATEEEEEELERQKEKEERNGVVENQEETVQSTKDCRSAEEETEERKERKESGGDVQQEQQQEATTEQDCKTLENCLQTETVTS